MKKCMYKIIAKRWFNRNHGNTYHSCYVYEDGRYIGGINYAYGYGEHYLQTALEILQNAGKVERTDIMLTSGCKKDTYDFMQDIRNNPDKYSIVVSDVARKKDL